MYRFQRGDISIDIGGKPYALRLTMGALAQIDQDFGVSGPIELAAKFKSFKENLRSEIDAKTLLACLLRPCTPNMPSLETLNAEEFMPAIARLFERSFGGVS